MSSFLDEIYEQAAKKDKEKRRENILKLQRSFSLQTQRNISNVKKEDSVVFAQDEMRQIAKKAIQGSLSSVQQGKDIIEAINAKRKITLTESIEKLTLRLIDDCLSFEEENVEQKTYDFEDVILAGKLTNSMQAMSLEEAEVVLSSIFSRKSMLKSENISLPEKMDKLFYSNYNATNDGLAFMELFCQAFCEKRNIKKPSVHAPIYEALISYI